MLPKIYLINVKSRTDRLETVMMEFNKHNLIDNVIVVDACRYDDEEISIFGQGYNPNEISISGAPRNKEFACYISHMRALKLLVDSDATEAIICEDDIILRYDFVEQYEKIRHNFPNRTDIVYFCTMSNYDGFNNENKIWIDDNHTLIKHTGSVVWGTQMYWISKSYARKVLHVFYSRPAGKNILHPIIITSELVSTITIPYHSYVMLVIEDMINISDLRENRNISYHFKSGFFNYGTTLLWRLVVLAVNAFGKYRKRIQNFINEMDEVPLCWSNNLNNLANSITKSYQ